MRGGLRNGGLGGIVGTCSPPYPSKSESGKGHVCPFSPGQGPYVPGAKPVASSATIVTLYDCAHLLACCVSVVCTYYCIFGLCFLHFVWFAVGTLFLWCLYACCLPYVYVLLCVRCTLGLSFVSMSVLGIVSLLCVSIGHMVCCEPELCALFICFCVMLVLCLCATLRCKCVYAV